MSRTIPPALAAHIAGQVQTVAVMVTITTLQGVVLGLTTLDYDLTFSGVTYRSMDSVTASAVRASLNTGVDNLDVVGVLSSAYIREVDLLAGLYDGAAIELFLVNYRQSPLVDRVVLLTGTLGEIHFSEGTFTAEIRSLSQRLTQQILELTSPTCRVRALGDSRCKVPVTRVLISAITQAATALVTTATAHGLSVGLTTRFEDVGGMTPINNLLGMVQTVPSGTTFTVNINSSAFSAYTSGGQIGFQFVRSVSSVTSPLVITFGSDAHASAFFTYGRVIFSSGLNAGLQREVKSHSGTGSTAVLTLQESFPFAVAPGDTALLEAGCDRTLSVCTSRFNNATNARLESYLPGNDALARRGRR